MDSYLYAVGGYDGQTQLNTMERYNVSRDVWEPMASMGHCRSAHGVTGYQGKLFVFGELGCFTAWSSEGPVYVRQSQRPLLSLLHVASTDGQTLSRHIHVCDV